jgi:hypothetical protein
MCSNFVVIFLLPQAFAAKINARFSFHTLVLRSCSIFVFAVHLFYQYQLNSSNHEVPYDVIVST